MIMEFVYNSFLIKINNLNKNDNSVICEVYLKNTYTKYFTFKYYFNKKSQLELEIKNYIEKNYKDIFKNSQNLKEKLEQKVNLSCKDLNKSISNLNGYMKQVCSDYDYIFEIDKQKSRLKYFLLIPKENMNRHFQDEDNTLENRIKNKNNIEDLKKIKENLQKYFIEKYPNLKINSSKTKNSNSWYIKIKRIGNKDLTIKISDHITRKQLFKSKNYLYVNYSNYNSEKELKEFLDKRIELEYV